MKYIVEEHSDEHGTLVDNIFIISDQPRAETEEIRFHVEFSEQFGSPARWRSAIVKDRFDEVYHREFNNQFGNLDKAADLPGVKALDDFGNPIWDEMTLEKAIQIAKKVHQ